MIHTTQSQAKPSKEDYHNFCNQFNVAEQFGTYLGIPGFVAEKISPYLKRGIHREEHSHILERINLLIKKNPHRKIKILELSAGTSIRGKNEEHRSHSGSPWLSRYLASQHSERVEVTACDLKSCIQEGQIWLRNPCRRAIEPLINMTLVHWFNGKVTVTANSFSKTLHPTWYAKLRNLINSNSHDLTHSFYDNNLTLADFYFNRSEQTDEHITFTSQKDPRIVKLNFHSFGNFLMPYDKTENEDTGLAIVPPIYRELEQHLFGLRMYDGICNTEASDFFKQKDESFDLIFFTHMHRECSNDLYRNSDTLIESLSTLLTAEGEILLGFDDYTHAPKKLYHYKDRDESTECLKIPRFR